MAPRPDKSRGRPSRFPAEVLAAIPHWRAMGITTDQIAEILGTTTNSLKVACHKERVSLAAPTSSGIKQALTKEQWGRLDRAAVDRGIPVMHLVIDLLATIADDNMFDAVLDDAPEPANNHQDSLCSARS